MHEANLWPSENVLVALAYREPFCFPVPCILQKHPCGWLINSPGVEELLNSPVATADNFVYLTRISLGGNGAEKATDGQLTLNTAVRFFVITTEILPRIYLRMKYLYVLLGSIILFIIK